MGKSSCGTAMIVLATILGPIVLILLAVSFATDHWLEFGVDKTQFSSATSGNSRTAAEFGRISNNRHRGLFRECYPGNDTQFLRVSTDVVDGYCFNIQYAIPEKGKGEYSSEYLSRIHLTRCHLALFILAIFSFILSYIFGLVICCWRRSKWAYTAGLWAYIAAFSTAASIAFFHGAEYLERNKIDDTNFFYTNWGEELQNATTRTYGWSYALGWVSMILAALTATLYSLAGCYLGGERYVDRDIIEKHGRGREYIDRSYPQPLEAPYPEYYYAGQQHGYPGPYLYDVENKRALPAIGYGEQPYWQWS